MDKIEKALRKLTDGERVVVRNILQKLYSRQTRGLNISRLKGYPDIYRVRKGRLRIIFRMSDNDIYLLKIDRRSDTTYNEF